jgi:hypothetical protein
LHFVEQFFNLHIFGPSFKIALKLASLSYMTCKMSCHNHLSQPQCTQLYATPFPPQCHPSQKQKQSSVEKRTKNTSSTLSGQVTLISPTPPRKILRSSKGRILTITISRISAATFAILQHLLTSRPNTAVRGNTKQVSCRFLFHFNVHVV